VSKPEDVDSYIAGAAEDARPKLDQLRRLITATVPEAEEGISWGVPFYKYHGVLAGFAAYKNHVSLGFGAGGLSHEDREQLEAQGYATGKKTFRIRFDQEVPTAAIRRLLKAQVRVNEASRA
jgi:uncharacterized protein YdhG (YjbR/CyaY superfamily)